MKLKHFIIFLFLNIFFIKAQSNQSIDSLFKNVFFSKSNNNIIENSEVDIFIKILDAELNTLVDSLFNYKPLKYTIIESYKTDICDCVKKSNFVKYTKELKKKVGWTNFSYSELWNKSERDTLKYINLIKKFNRALVLPNDTFRLIRKSEYLKTDKLNLKHLILYDHNIYNTIKKLLKKNKKRKKEILKYLEQNLDYFHKKKRKIKPQSIGITNITIDCSGKILGEMDIYDSHYLLTIDKEKLEIENIEMLWIY